MKKYSKEEKSKWLEAWKQSRKRPWSFAKEQGLNPQTFSNWVKTEKPVSGFVEIRPAQKGVVTGGREIILERGDTSARLPVDLSQQEMESVATLWRALS